MRAGAESREDAALEEARSVLFRAVQHRKEKVHTVYGAMLALEQAFQRRPQPSGSLSFACLCRAVCGPQKPVPALCWCST